VSKLDDQIKFETELLSNATKQTQGPLQAYPFIVRPPLVFMED